MKDLVSNPRSKSSPKEALGGRVLPFRRRGKDEPEPRDGTSPMQRPPGGIQGGRSQSHLTDVTPLRGSRFDDAGTSRVPAWAVPDGPGAGRDEVEPLKHRGPRVRHLERPLPIRLALPVGLAFVIIGGPVALLMWIFQSPALELREMDVRPGSNGRVTARYIHETLRPAVGWNLPRLSLEWVDQRLRENHPWVESTDVRKHLPNRLHVRVVEKQAAAIARGENGLEYVDARGKVITAFTPGEGAEDLPLLARSSSDVGLEGALDLLREIEDVRPRWTASLSEIEVLGESDFRVWNAELPFPILVRSGTLEEKLAYLDRLLPELERRYDGVDAVDLRFARRIILQPSVRKHAAKSGRSSSRRSPPRRSSPRHSPEIHQRGVGG